MELEHPSDGSASVFAAFREDRTRGCCAVGGGGWEGEEREGEAEAGATAAMKVDPAAQNWNGGDQGTRGFGLSEGEWDWHSEK